MWVIPEFESIILEQCNSPLEITEIYAKSKLTNLRKYVSYAKASSKYLTAFLACCSRPHNNSSHPFIANPWNYQWKIASLRAPTMESQSINSISWNLMIEVYQKRKSHTSLALGACLSILSMYSLALSWRPVWNKNNPAKYNPWNVQTRRINSMGKWMRPTDAHLSPYSLVQTEGFQIWGGKSSHLNFHLRNMSIFFKMCDENHANLHKA